ncbi:MAG TPA: DinB family protein [Bryobacteraceae bacterium]|nr:DinB family protein [Bryobacteraceae bacterium]
MKSANDENLLDTILDSWDRNNRILVNLLRAIPQGVLDARVMPGSPSVAEMFTHIHYVRLVFLSEDAPEFATQLPTREWLNEGDAARVAEELDSSARAVRDAVGSLVRSGQKMRLHYDHPLLYLQHMIWHEGYHHGQIKLALKAAGCPLENKEIGPHTWRVWMDKTGAV